MLSQEEEVGIEGWGEEMEMRWAGGIHSVVFGDGGKCGKERIR
jgi:hypothetical protein